MDRSVLIVLLCVGSISSAFGRCTGLNCFFDCFCFVLSFSFYYRRIFVYTFYLINISLSLSDDAKKIKTLNIERE